MLKVKIIGISLLICMVSTIILPTAVLAQTELHVGEGQQFTTISDAISAASEGDTIFVHEGIYSELLHINKNSITLSGDEATIDGSAYPNEEDGLITIFSNIHGVTIEGFEIRNFIFDDHGGNGIFVQNYSYGNIFRNNNIHDVNGAGIFLAEDTSSNLISDNHISNSENGIGANYSHGNQIVDNQTEANNIGIFLGNGCSGNLVNGNSDIGSNCGINLGGSINNQIRDNVIAGSSEGIWIGSDDSLSSSQGNVIKGNTIQAVNVVGIYLGNAHENQVMDNTLTVINLNTEAQGIVLNQDHAEINPSNNNIQNNSISGFKMGVILNNGAYGNSVKGNCVNDSTRHGILLFGAINNNIQKNIVQDSGKFGIAVVQYSSGNQIKKNDVSRSSGFDLFEDDTCTNNIWKHNEFETSDFQ